MLTEIMSSKKSEQTNLDLYVAYGALTVKVVEAADPIDVLFNPGENTRANPNTKTYDVYLSIDISDPNNQIITSCPTETHKYQRGTLNFHKEACQFSGIYSYFKMRIALYADSGRSLFCTGLIDIPISRLEEDVVISQWYQLSHPGPFKLRETADGIPISPPDAQPKSFIRSAVKLEIYFHKDGMKLISELTNSKTAAKGNKQQINSFNPSSPEGHIPGSPVPPKDAAGRPSSTRSPKSGFNKNDSSASKAPQDAPGRPASTRSNISNASFGMSRGDIRRAEKEREKAVERERNDGSAAVKTKSGGTIVTRKPLFIDTNFDDLTADNAGTFSPSAATGNTGADKAAPLSSPDQGGLMARASTGIGLQRQATMTNNNMARVGTMNRSASMDVANKETLPVGLIDYFLIMGPTSMPVGYSNSGAAANNSSRRGSFIIRKGEDKKGGESPAETSQASGEPTVVGCVEVALWDRFPKEDHEDVPLPAKMEWFGCPDGSKVLKSVTRPPVKFSSFIMTSADEELFGVTLTFYVAIGDYAAGTDGYVPVAEKSKSEEKVVPRTPSCKMSARNMQSAQRAEEELTDSDNDTASLASPRPGSGSRKFFPPEDESDESDEGGKQLLPLDADFVSAWTQEVEGLSTLEGKLTRGLGPKVGSFSNILSVKTAIQASKGKFGDDNLVASAPSRDAFIKRGSSNSSMSFKSPSSISGSFKNGDDNLVASAPSRDAFIKRGSSNSSMSFKSPPSSSGSFKNGLPSSSGQREKVAHPQSWVGVTLCVMTRGPFVEQLSQCLHLIYIYYILPQLALWEDQIRSDASFTAQRNSAGPHRETTVRLELENSLKLKVETILMTLVMEAPVPMPGVFAVCVPLSMSFNSDIDPLVAEALKRNINNEAVMCSQIFPGVDSHAKVDTVTTNSEMSLRAKNNVASQTIGIKFDLAPAEDLPSCPYPIYLFFQYLTPRTALDALACAHCECKLLFHSRDTSKLPIVCEAIRTLLYPMRWAHVYLPVVPGVLLDLLDAPVPYVLGISSDNLQNVGYEYLRDTVLIDVDAGTIEYMEDVVADNKIVFFPDHVDRWLMLGIKMILNDGNTIGHEDILPQATTATGGGIERENITSTDEKSKQLQILIFDCMVGLLRHVPDCLFFLDKTSPVFNRPLFLKEFVPSRQCEEFVQFLTSTTSFNQFAACIHDSSLSIFIEASQRMVLELTKAEELETAAEHTIGHHSELMLTVGRRRSSVMDSGAGSHNTPVKVVASVAAAAAAHGNSPPPKGLTLPRRGSFNESEIKQVVPRKGSFNFNESENKQVGPRRGSFNFNESENKQVGPRRGSFNFNESENKSGVSRKGSFHDDHHHHHHHDDDEEHMVDEMFPEWITATQMLLPQRHSIEGVYKECSFTGNLREVLNARIALYTEILDDTIPRFMDDNGMLLDASPVFTYTRAEPKAKTPKSAKPKSSMSSLFGQVDDGVQVYDDDNIDELFEELDAPAASSRKAGGRLSSSNRRTSVAGLGGLDETAAAVPGSAKAPGALSRVSTLSRTATFTKKTIVTAEAAADGNLSVSTASHTPDKAGAKAQRRSSTAVGRRSSVGALNFQDVTKIVPERLMSTRGGPKSTTGNAPKKRAFSFDSDDEDNDFAMGSTTLKPLGNTQSNPTLQPFSETSVSAENRRPSLMLLSDKKIKVACFYPIPAVSFDPSTIDDLTAEHHNLKTLMNVAKSVGVDEREMFKAFKKIIGDVQPKSLSRWGLQNTHVQNILPPSVLEYIHDGTSAPTGAQSIAMFLQHSFASTVVTEEELDRMLTECETALQNAENRELLMKILKQDAATPISPKVSTPPPKKSKKAAKPAGWKVFPVQPKAYEDLKELCNILLHVCYEQRDYFMAHQLLEAAGSYFTTITFNDNGSDEDNDSDYDSVDEEDVEATTYCEFLSESICRHSIFQNPALWQVVMNNHIPTTSYNKNSKVKFPAPPTPREPKADKQVSVSTAELIQEAKSLLYRMLQIGVAVDKALGFVKLVVADYKLSVQQFFTLQRFTTDTWDESGDEHDHHHDEGEGCDDGADGFNEDDDCSETDGQLTEYERQARDQQREREFQWKRLEEEKAERDRQEEISNNGGGRHTGSDGDGGGGGGGGRDDNDSERYDSQPTPRPKKSTDSAPGATPPPPQKRGSFFGLFSPALTDVSALTLDSFSASGGESAEKNGRGSDNEAETSVLPPVKTGGGTSLAPFVQAVAEHISLEECSEDGIVIDKEVVVTTVDILTDISSVDMAQQWLVSGSGDGTVYVTNLGTENFDTVLLKNSVGITCVKFLPGGGGFVCTTADGFIKVFSLPTPEEEASIPTQFKSSLLQMEDDFSDHNTSGQENGSFASHRSGGGANPLAALRVAEMKGHLDRVLVVAVSGFLLGEGKKTKGGSSGGGWMVATGDAAGVICIFKGNDGGVSGNGKASVRATLRSAGEITCLVLSCTNNGRYQGPMHPDASVSGGSSSTSSITTTATVSGAHDCLAVGTALGSVVVLSATTGKPVFRQERGHNGRVNCLAFRSESELLTGGEDQCVRLWDLLPPPAPGGGKAKVTSKCTLGRHSSESDSGIFGAVSALAVVNGLVVCATEDNILRIWDVAHDHVTPLISLKGHTDLITDIVWQLGDTFGTSSWDGSIRLWDLVKGSCIEEIRTGSPPDYPVSMDDGSFAQLCYAKNTNSVDVSKSAVVAFPSPCMAARSEQGSVKIWQR